MNKECHYQKKDLNWSQAYQSQVTLPTPLGLVEWYLPSTIGWRVTWKPLDSCPREHGISSLEKRYVPALEHPTYKVTCTLVRRCQGSNFLGFCRELTWRQREDPQFPTGIIVVKKEIMKSIFKDKLTFL